MPGQSYAWIVTSNSAYLPSLKAMLGALEHYGYARPGFDVHVIHTEDIAEYVNKKACTSELNIVPVPVDWLTKPGHSLPHNLIYSKYRHAWKIAAQYDAIFHIDCDCLVLDNFIQYFEIAAKTNLIPCAQFPHTAITVEHYKTIDPDFVNIHTPLANFPIFYNPANYALVMLAIWNMQPDEQTSNDPQRNHEMYFFNKALFEHGCMDKILVLPGNLWVTDNFVNQTPINYEMVCGKEVLRNITGDRIQIIHNKWWKEGVSEEQISRDQGNPITVNNIETMMSVFRRFS